MRRRMGLTAVLAVLLLLTGCGAGDSKLDVKAGGKSLPFGLKGSGIYNSVKTFTETKDGQTSVAKASSVYVVLGTYEIDSSSGMRSMEKPVTAADQVRISLQLIGQEGTDDKTGLKPGAYPAKADKFGKLDYVSIAYFADGKETKADFDLAKATGDVKITAASAESVSGEIDLTEGDKSIKGSFTAKAPVKK